MHQQRVETGHTRVLVIGLQQGILRLSRHWLAWANLFWGVLIGLPWLAPVLMAMGVIEPARAIYFVYSFLCHQLADRSFFLFGPKLISNSRYLAARFTSTWHKSLKSSKQM